MRTNLLSSQGVRERIQGSGEGKASGVCRTLGQSESIPGIEGRGHFYANFVTRKFRKFLNQPIAPPGHKHCFKDG